VWKCSGEIEDSHPVGQKSAKRRGRRKEEAAKKLQKKEKVK